MKKLFAMLGIFCITSFMMCSAATVDVNAALTKESSLLQNDTGTNYLFEAPVSYNIKREDKVRSYQEGKTKKKIEEYPNGIELEQKDYLSDREVISNQLQHKVVEHHEMTTSYTIPEESLNFVGNKVIQDSFFVLKVHATTHSHESSGSDKTGTIRLNSKIWYTVSTVNGKEYVKLTKATGSLESLTGHSGISQGSGISIASAEAIVGRYGVNTKGKYVSNSVVASTKRVPHSWSRKVNWSAVGYSSGTSVNKTGVTQTVKLKRGKSSWTFIFQNHVL